jgi:anaerobic magnesium-protoporphyrin IX monomethyl ester cyclase
MVSFNRVALVALEIPGGDYLPSLGLLYIASVLEKNGIEVRIFDQGQKPDITDEILSFDPGVIGITSVTCSINKAFKIAEDTKRTNPNIKVVIGGAHVTAMPYETLENPFVDFVVKGEGEYPMLNLVKALQRGGEDIDKVESLFYKLDGGIKKNKEASDMDDATLTDLPYPAFHLLDQQHIFEDVSHGIFTKGKRVLPLMTARGCPQTCTFCCRLMGFDLRERSVQNVMEEIRFNVEKYKIDELYFEDDDFTNNRPRALEILRAIRDARLGIYIKFANGLRADNVDEELLIAIKEAGGYWVGFGIESGSQKVLEIMKKKLDLNVAKQNVAIAKRLGLFVGANCIVGYPGETREDMAESIRFFKDLKLDSCAIVSLVPFPKTALHGQCKQKGYLTKYADNYDNYFFKIFNPQIMVLTGEVSENEIRRFIKIFYIQFYMHPKRVFRAAKFMIKKLLKKPTQTLRSAKPSRYPITLEDKDRTDNSSSNNASIDKITTSV